MLTKVEFLGFTSLMFVSKIHTKVIYSHHCSVFALGKWCVRHLPKELVPGGPFTGTNRGSFCERCHKDWCSRGNIFRSTDLRFKLYSAALEQSHLQEAEMGKLYIHSGNKWALQRAIGDRNCKTQTKSMLRYCEVATGTHSDCATGRVPAGCYLVS